MAQSGAIRAGRAFVELFADDTALVRGLRAAEKKLKSFGQSISQLGKRLTGLGTAILTPLLAAGKAFASMGSDIYDMSKRTGLTAESLSALGYAAQLTGTSIDELEKGVRKMQRTIVDAGMGSKSAQEALSLLGLSYQQLSRLSPEEQFTLIAERLSQIKDPTLRAAVAMMIFGRSGTQLLPMLEQGAAGIKAMTDEAKRLGLVMSSKDAAAADALGDALDRMWMVVKMTSFQIGAALAPALEKLAGMVTQAMAKLNAWIEQNRQVIVMVAKVAVAMIAGGIALMVFGGIVSGLGIVLGKLAATITLVGTVLKTLAAVIAFLMQPIVVTIAAVAALGATILYATGAAGKALAWLGQKFATLKSDALAAWGGIGDALAAGDIALAGRILWLTLKMEWTRGVNFLEKIWLNFRNFFIQLAYDAFAGALSAAVIAWYTLEDGWTETVAFLQKVWNGFSSFFAKTWETMKAMATKAYLWIMKLFDKSINLEAAYSIVDVEKQKAIDAINQEQAGKNKEIENRRKERRDQTNQMRDAELEQIANDYTDRNTALDEEYNQRMADNAKELDDARKTWQDSLDTARKKRTDKERLEKSKKPDAFTSPDLSGLGTFDSQASKLSAAGSFSGFARFGLEGDSSAERMTKGIDQIAQNTKDMLQLQRDNEEVMV